MYYYIIVVIHVFAYFIPLKCIIGGRYRRRNLRLNFHDDTVWVDAVYEGIKKNSASGRIIVVVELMLF